MEEPNDDDDQPQGEEQSEEGGEDDSGSDQAQAEESESSSDDQESGETESSEASADELSDDEDLDAETPGEAKRQDNPFANLPKEIDYKVYCLMMTSDTNQLGTPGGPAGMSSAPWLATPLDQADIK